MKVSFTGITIYKTNIQNPYSKFAEAIRVNHLENSMQATPHTKDSKSVMILDGEDYKSFINRQIILKDIYHSYYEPTRRERKTLEAKATVVDLRDLSLPEFEQKINNL